jgi:hypothetical protein
VAPGMMKMVGREEERSVLRGGIFVPSYDAERGGRGDVVLGEESF